MTVRAVPVRPLLVRIGRRIDGRLPPGARSTLRSTLRSLRRRLPVRLDPTRTAHDAAHDTALGRAPGVARDAWFWDHYDWAANQIVSFLADDGVVLAGRAVADVGCGDGFIDLGIARTARPARLVAFDVTATDVDHLRTVAAAQGTGGDLPPMLQFVTCGATTIPAAAAEFDVVVSWSAFEHIADIDRVAGEIARIVKPDGTVFVQVWPLYFSERGSHLDEWLPDPFVHLARDHDEIAGEVRAKAGDAGKAGWGEYMLREFATLNRARLDDVQAALHRAGLVVEKVEIESKAVRIPREVSLAHPLTDLAVAGFKLLARPR